jgi:hypothetical protein
MPFITTDHIRDRLRLECIKAGGQRNWARAHNFGFSALSAVLCGKRNIGLRLQQELGIKKIVYWKDVKLSTEPEPPPSAPSE